MPTNPPPIDPIVEFPALGDPDFNNKAFDWATRERTHVAPQLAAVAANAFGNAVESAGLAAAASQAAELAEAQADLAALQANIAASAANFAGTWNMATAYTTGQSVVHQGMRYLALRPSTGQEPGIAELDWFEIKAGQDLVRQPTPISPLNGASNVALSPMLQASAYAPVYSVDVRMHRQFQVAASSDPAFANPVYESNVNADSVTVSPPLAQNSVFIWRCRDVAAVATSEWMDAQQFTTANVTINTPTVTVSGEPSSVPETPTISTSMFATTPANQDTHLSTDWEVRLASTNALVFSSYNNTTNLTSINVPAGILMPNTAYIFRARHNGNIYGNSAYGSVTATTLAAFTNDIGTPGAQGFGVGVAPQSFAGFSALTGTTDKTSANYGNYQYTDGSRMVWIPAFYYKVGTGSNGLVVNRIDVKSIGSFADLTAAQAQGYTIPRAFYEGGTLKQGFFVDKYHCANNGGTASSIANLSPLSTSSSRNPISALTGAPPNNYGGVLQAAKTRGAIFHACTIFQHTVLALLAKAHADASTKTTFCAWYTPDPKMPKGNNNGANYNDINDPAVTFQSISDTTGNASLNGSGNPFAKTTHNGQSCGVADVNGNVWDVTPGLSSDGTNYYVAGPSISQNGFTSANAFGAPSGWTNVGTTFGYAGVTGGRIGDGANQVLDHATSGNAWLMTSAGVALAAGVSANGTLEFGQDLANDGKPNLLAPLRGGGWGDGSGAGVFALRLGDVSGASNFAVGFRACSFGAS